MDREENKEKQRSIWAKRAEEVHTRGDFRAAAWAFRAALIDEPSSPHLMVMFARSLEKVNPHSPFRYYARKATMLSPGRTDGWSILAQGARNRREHARAASASKRCSVLDPKEPDGLLSFSRTQFQRQEYEDCLLALKFAAVLAPEDHFVRIAQARCLFRVGRHLDALKASSIAMDLGADVSGFGFDHCRIARAAGHPEITFPLLDKLEEFDSEFGKKRRILDLTVTVDDLRARNQ
jgi:tetratricopeptide (TPR) repeat protein